MATEHRCEETAPKTSPLEDEKRQFSRRICQVSCVPVSYPVYLSIVQKDLPVILKDLSHIYKTREHRTYMDLALSRPRPGFDSRCENHCKKQVNRIDTDKTPGPGHHSDTLTTWLKGLDPSAGWKAVIPATDTDYKKLIKQLTCAVDCCADPSSGLDWSRRSSQGSPSHDQDS
ncbi:hypothetical protein Bbelb_344850 [Branchiostoma belcheri]|nr:hypothetical protein Bbelb_344850 [Branchiostoma belcheri]